MAKSDMYFQTDTESSHLKIKMVELGLKPSQVARDLKMPKQELLKALQDEQSLGWARKLIKSYLSVAELLSEGENYVEAR